jgi:photosystem II stability/assembly factor-like uncharacterized protein
VIAIGAHGTILRTTDAGATWAAVASGTTATLRAIAIPGDGSVWVAGDGGTLLRSLDEGATFAPVNAGTTMTLTAVAAWSRSDVVVGGGSGQLRRSTDGGTTWSVLAAAPSGSAPSKLQAVRNSTTIWMTWSASVGRSTDSGASWTDVTTGTGIENYDVDAVDSNTAWASGRFSRLYRTTNGGTTWTNITGSTGTRLYTSVTALGPDAALALGDANTSATTDPTSGIPDYDGATASWSGSGFFGICLRAAPSTGSSWPTTGTCPTSNGTNWRSVPLHGGLATASTASTLSAGNTTASFRFGLKPPTTTTAGTYRAPITFEVTAPAG